MVQVTKRAERSTRCTFCHSFASNIIVCFFPSFCVCVPARVCPRARTRVCAGAEGGYVRACVCVLGGGGAFVRGSERARARECVMCCFSIPNRSLHNASSAPFGESGKRPEKMMQPNAKVLSTSCRKTCHCRVLVRENSHKGQNGKATVFFFFFCAMPFSWFLFCHVEHRHLTTCTKACQTISGLVRKTCGRLIIPRHAIG